MASVFKRPESSIWWAQFYVVDPATAGLKKIRRSTGQTSKKAAMASAREMERTEQGVIKAGGDKAQRAKAILAKAVSEIEQEVFTTLSARRYLAELLALATGEEMPIFSVEGWLGEWLRRKSRESSASTIARYKKHIETFTTWLGDARKCKPLESVTMADVRAWRETLQDEGRAGKTVNNYVKDVGAAFRSAIREGLISFNPCSALEAVSTDDSLERKPFSIAEVVLLLAAAPSAEWRGMILAAPFTGLRLGDLARLRWESIDLEKALITLIPSKTKRKKREVKIPIQPDLLTYLKEVADARTEGEVFVFSALATLSINGGSGLSEAFTKVMLTAGVDRGKTSREVVQGEPKGKGRVIYERGFHSFRHTFTSWLRTAGVAEEDRMALTGHSTRESHAIYSHTDAEALRKAITKLPTLK